MASCQEKIDDMKQLAFLVYDSRSGSTLLAAMLNRYEGISVSQESNFIATILESPVRVVTSESVDQLFEALNAEVQFREMNIDLGAYRKGLTSRLPMSKVDFIRDLAEFYFNGRDPDATLGIVKGARQMFHIDELTANFENSAVIHIYRDGRAVYASKRKSSAIDGNPMEKNIVRAAIDWRNKLHLMLGNKHVVNVKYEDLLLRSDQVLTALLTAMGLNASDIAITKHPAEYSAAIGNRQRHLHANVSQAPNPEIAQQWKTELSEFHREVYETINAELLHQLGYEVMLDQTKAKLLRRTAVRIYIYICWLLLALRKTKQTFLLLGDRGALHKKIAEKLAEFKAMQHMRKDNRR